MNLTLNDFWFFSHISQHHFTLSPLCSIYTHYVDLINGWSETSVVAYHIALRITMTTINGYYTKCYTGSILECTDSEHILLLRFWRNVHLCQTIKLYIYHNYGSWKEMRLLTHITLKWKLECKCCGWEWNTVHPSIVCNCLIPFYGVMVFWGGFLPSQSQLYPALAQRAGYSMGKWPAHRRALAGSVSCSRTLWHASQLSPELGFRTSDLPITSQPALPAELQPPLVKYSHIDKKCVTQRSHISVYNYIIVVVNTW